MGTRGDDGERLTEVDLLIEVLSRLRVKPLLRCKSVSKSWYALISSPNFVKSHLQRAITSCVVDDEDKNNFILHLHRDWARLKYRKADGSFSLFNLEIGHTTTNLKFPYPQGEYDTDPPSLLVGFVCGIACVCVDDSYNFSKYWVPTADLPTKIYLWNPAIRQSKLIRPHTIHDDGGAGVALGFGFDPIDFDFKVVRVVKANSCAISAAVYSTNRDAWRNIDSKLTDVPRSTRLKVCLHGFLITTGKRGLIAFDLNKEVFVCDIKLPVNIKSVHSLYDTQDVVFKDSIAFIAYMIDKPHRINLWTLDDEACLRGGGVQASWTLKLNIGLDEQFFDVQGLNNIVDLLFFSRGWWYSLGKIVNRYIYPRDGEFIYFEEDFFKYSESLLSFEGSIPVNWCADEDVDSEDEGESIEDFKYDPEESITDSEDIEESSEADNGECRDDSAMQFLLSLRLLA
ncbi:F-box protein At5g07610-like isoform X2 [Daucus carota subsp. sativus]|uniref:F-box protein At5g07610-like isoform X2 n=1 Tax=Daucus carota subsp. sativus TaxID=79200 RepID=UPI0007F033CA|nr:PREDICTED: F-box protein At5g07610-like isoform X2 [Daucus carota subsp. sativus]